MKYKINGACKSEIGKVRENNEDNYYFNFKILKEDNEGNNKAITMQFENVDNVICSIFDGMGGETKGERASYIASSTLKEYVQKNTNKEFVWESYIDIANKKICKEMLPNQRMGTTMAAILFSEKYIDICNIGDSRIYSLKNKKLKQISKDHTEANLQEKLNINIGHKARLTQHLGIRKEEMVLTPYKNKYDYNEFDKMLICSDGLTDMISDKEIEKIMSQQIQPREIVDELIKKALEKGGIDNTTVIVLEIKKAVKPNYKIILSMIIAILTILIIFAIYVRSSNFEIIKDEYSGPIIVGQSYKFEYKGNVDIEISNNNIKYSNGKITAIKEGTTVITVIDKKGKILYKQTVKIFPK